LCQIFLKIFWLSFIFVGVDIKYIDIRAMILKPIPKPMRAMKLTTRLSLIPSSSRGFVDPLS